jgi:hypothetical protein
MVSAVMPSEAGIVWWVAPRRHGNFKKEAERKTKPPSSSSQMKQLIDLAGSRPTAIKKVPGGNDNGQNTAWK